MPLLDEIHSITRTVEVILRGQTKWTEEERLEWTNSCYDFYRMCSSSETFQLYADLPSVDKMAHLEAAVKLFNKARNISSSFTESRTVLKGACAWIFSLFADKNAKVLSIMIKALSHCAAEFVAHGRGDLGHQCAIAVAGLWEAGSESDEVRHLPPLEVALLKECVLHCVMHTAQGLATGDCTWHTMKSTIATAVELSNGLPLKSSVALVERIISVGRQASSTANYEVAASLLETALRLLKTLSNRALQEMGGSKQEEWMNLFADYKAICLLCLTFLHTAHSDTGKARVCMEELESGGRSPSSGAVLENAIGFAKLMLAIDARNTSLALSTTKALLSAEECSNFDGILIAVRRVVEMMAEQTPSAEGYESLFEQLLSKYPSDQEFSIARLAYLEAATAIETVDPDSGMRRSLEICGRIIAEHTSKLRLLSETQCERLGAVLEHTAAWLREHRQWRLLCQWCDLMIQLANCVHRQELLLSVQREKAEALRELKEFSQALNLSRQCVALGRDYESVLTFFQCLLSYEDIPKQSLVSYFLQQLQENVKVELWWITSCCATVEHSDFLSHQCKAAIVEELILNWLRLYPESEAQPRRTEPDEEAHRPTSLAAQDETFLEMLNLYCSYLLQCFGDHELPAGTVMNALSPAIAKNLCAKLLLAMDITKAVFAQRVGPGGGDIHVLGRPSDLLDVANFVALTGFALLQDTSSAEESSVRLVALERGGSCCESAGWLFGQLPKFSDKSILKVRVKCLALAAGAHMDAFRLLCEGSLPRDRNEDHILQARQNAELADELIHQQGEFSSDEDGEILGSVVVTGLAAYTYHGSSEDCDAFVQRKRSRFLLLPLHHLEQCVELAAHSRICSSDILRCLLLIALQACKSKPEIPYRMVGSLYRRLLELSPSRRAAFDKLQEFLQQLQQQEQRQEKKHEQGEQEKGIYEFDQSDIDYIFALAYNYGIALLDLDQLSLAEQFLKQTLELISYASDAMQQWRPSLLEAQQAILRARQKMSAVSVSPMLDEGIRPQAEDELLPRSPIKQGHLAMDMFKA